jgi:outer membrane protein OmpA-like peptidoglycan-associated protein
MKIIICLFTLIISTLAFAQEYPNSTNIADCDGAASLPKNGQITIAFTGSPGIFYDVSKYQTKFPEQNSLWLVFTAQLTGFLSLEFFKAPEEVELVFFKSEKDQICDLLGKGELKKSFSTVFANEHIRFEATNKAHDFLHFNKGESLWIYINNSDKRSLRNFQGKVAFQPSDKEEVEKSRTNIVDLRSDVTSPTFDLSFLSSADNSPIIAEVVIKNSKNYDAFYNASSILIGLERTLKFDLKVDAEGFFPKDTSIRITDLQNSTIAIRLDPVIVGSQMKLEGITFFPESDNLTPEAKNKLKRTRDFLAINADLKIEVQGHVNQAGKNNFRAKKLSRKRAKSVRDYLVSSGIEKSRVRYKGYGNEFMIYPEANTPEEKQANRRVEIKIL